MSYLFVLGIGFDSKWYGFLQLLLYYSWRARFIITPKADVFLSRAGPPPLLRLSVPDIHTESAESLKMGKLFESEGDNHQSMLHDKQFVGRYLWPRLNTYISICFCDNIALKVFIFEILTDSFQVSSHPIFMAHGITIIFGHHYYWDVTNCLLKL